MKDDNYGLLEDVVINHEKWYWRHSWDVIKKYTPLSMSYAEEARAKLQ